MGEKRKTCNAYCRIGPFDSILASFEHMVSN